jgi:heme/copper-type cytochrome/quinol oxidase subunit 2
VYNKSEKTNQEFNPGPSVLIYTIIPALILILIAFPTLKLLYLMDEASDPTLAAYANDFDRLPPAPHPLDIPEASDEDEIPFEIIEPYPNDPDRHLTVLRNEVRIAYMESHTISNMSRENPEAVSEQQVDEYEQAFYDSQKVLKRYLNENYDGNFDVEDT